MTNILGVSLVIIGIVFLSLFIALVCMPFLLAGYNWGLADAFHLETLSFGQAFWCSVLLASVGGHFRSYQTNK